MLTYSHWTQHYMCMHAHMHAHGVSKRAREKETKTCRWILQEWPNWKLELELNTVTARTISNSNLSWAAYAWQFHFLWSEKEGLETPIQKHTYIEKKKHTFLFFHTSVVYDDALVCTCDRVTCLLSSRAFGDFGDFPAFTLLGKHTSQIVQMVQSQR